MLKNEEVQLHAAHTETSISYEFKTSDSKKEDYDLCLQDSQILLLPERNALYGDHGWRGMMLQAIQNAVRLFPFDNSFLV